MDASSLLDSGRAAFSFLARKGIKIGMSQSSRQQLEGFYNNGTALFNQLYNAAENKEVNNTTAILALRSKFSYLVSESITGTAKSKTSGTNIDTQA